MPMVRQACALAVIVATFLALAVPVHADSNIGCVNVDVAQWGQDLGIYTATWTNAVGVAVVTGAPGDGLTLSVIVAPPLCGPGGMPIGIPSLPGGQDLPDLSDIPLVP